MEKVKLKLTPDEALALGSCCGGYAQAMAGARRAGQGRGWNAKLVSSVLSDLALRLTARGMAMETKKFSFKTWEALSVLTAVEHFGLPGEDPFALAVVIAFCEEAEPLYG